MAEETKQQAPEGDAPKPEEGRGERSQRRGDQTPIEDLYDLSKPIPRPDRPNREEHDKELGVINADIDRLKEERGKLQDKIDASMDSGRNSEIGKARDELQQLRSKKGALIDEKKAIRAKLDVMRSQADRLVKDRKDTRANVRFSSVEEIDKEIAKLQRQQETTSMSLTQEKKLIKEMDSLQASKKLVAGLKSTETSLDDVKEQRKLISAQISAKDKEIDAVQVEIDAKSEAIKSMSEKETDKRDGIKVLFAERDELRRKINERMKDRDALRTEFREKNNTWYNYQRAIRAQKKIQYEEEKKKREEERAAWQKAKEEEELKKIPYEEEMALCDYLADYLTRTYLTKDNGVEKHSVAKKEEVVAVKDDPFAGFKPVKKNDDEEYFGKGKGKKKRNRNKEKKAAAGPFTLNMDTFEQFGLLNLTPPTSVDQVEKSVEELRAKKKWFSEQPRGSVPTATEIRKANERAAAKVKGSNTDSGSPSKPKKGDANFSLSNDDFAPLGAAGSTSSSINATWGQKTEAAAEDGAQEESAGEETPAAAEEDVTANEES